MNRRPYFTPMVMGVVVATLSCTPGQEAGALKNEQTVPTKRFIVKAVGSLEDLRSSREQTVALALKPLTSPTAMPAKWSKVQPHKFFSSIRWETHGNYVIPSDSRRVLCLKTRSGAVLLITVIFNDYKSPSAFIQTSGGTVELSSAAHPILRELAGEKGFSPFSPARALPPKK